MVEYDERTALLVVDVQNDFAHPEGSLYVAGAEEAIARMDAEIGHAHDAGALIVYTQDRHPEHTPHFEQDGGTWPVHCVEGTWGAILHADLPEIDSAPLILKGEGGQDAYSAFSVCAIRKAARRRRRSCTNCCRRRGLSAWSSWAWRRTTACWKRRSTRGGWTSRRW